MGKPRKLRVPMALAFALSGAATAMITAPGCEEHGSPGDASCAVHCVYEGPDNGNCPFPTCATGSNLDVCPAGCIPEPIV
jgi:hypothetical protein